MHCVWHSWQPFVAHPSRSPCLPPTALAGEGGGDDHGRAIVEADPAPPLHVAFVEAGPLGRSGSAGALGTPVAPEQVWLGVAQLAPQSMTRVNTSESMSRKWLLSLALTAQGGQPAAQRARRGWRLPERPRNMPAQPFGASMPWRARHCAFCMMRLGMWSQRGQE